MLTCKLPLRRLSASVLREFAQVANLLDRCSAGAPEAEQRVHLVGVADTELLALGQALVPVRCVLDLRAPTVMISGLLRQVSCLPAGMPRVSARLASALPPMSNRTAARHVQTYYETNTLHALPGTYQRAQQTSERPAAQGQRGTCVHTCVKLCWSNSAWLGCCASAPVKLPAAPIGLR